MLKQFQFYIHRNAIYGLLFLFGNGLPARISLDI